MARDQRTRLNNMIAERAPGAAVIEPGKNARTDVLGEDEQDQEVDQPAVDTQAPRPRSVFDAPLQRDVEQQPSQDDPASKP